MLLAADLANIDRMITHNERLLGLARECGFLLLGRCGNDDIVGAASTPVTPEVARVATGTAAITRDLRVGTYPMSLVRRVELQ